MLCVLVAATGVAAGGGEHTTVSKKVTTPPKVVHVDKKVEVKHPTVHKKEVVRKHKVRKKKRYYRKARAAYRYHRHHGRGSGDCWTNSEYLYSSLTSSGRKARIIQYSTSMSPRHRSVQVYQNGGWVNYDYKANGYAQTYHATSNSVNGKVVKG